MEGNCHVTGGPASNICVGQDTREDQCHLSDSRFTHDIASRRTRAFLMLALQDGTLLGDTAKATLKVPNMSTQLVRSAAAEHLNIFLVV